ncbi:TetR/AcrR family transcriptional regulator [Leclercia adecarboxylata]|uniref:TetR/AcrR family transcriptional regulator n=1 Tax=Leclercia adecarboxylata TaxID=83655 RepID=UPI002DBA5459|nr:TetR/AcrR family transcriptional regulator [Leclercia adecarboxylata]MEB6377542.1 TetR/AcrR family transcriptional regulator [Leclercia adecarboxylata]
MARPKKISNEDVLNRVIPVFWKSGLAGTSLGQLEDATDINRSSLYATFCSKEQLFVSALQHYVSRAPAQFLLQKQPYGWDNIEAFLLAAPFNNPAVDGCFLVNSSREVGALPAEALTIVRNFRDAVVAQIGLNVPEEDAGENRDVMADIIWSTLAEACLEANDVLDREAWQQRVARLLQFLKPAR